VASGGGIVTMPTELTGAVFTALMWQLIQDNINNGIVAPLGCRIYNSATANLTTNSEHTCTWDTNLTDNDGMHSTTTNTDRIYMNWDGFYQVKATIGWDTSNSTGDRRVRVMLNGTTEIGRVEGPPTTGGACCQTVTVDRHFAAGDYIQILAFQNSGVTLAIAPNSEFTPICSVVRA
jgi:hypothetical protein